MKVHCLFEQSGTFKNEFKKLGIEAYDYDIQNNYGETDHVIDLFNEIEVAYTHTHTHTVFDDIGKDDLIMAFFPCVRFEDQILLYFRGDSFGDKNKPISDLMERDITLMDELAHLYKLVNMMFIVCIRKELRLIMENPYSSQHFLKNYWCYKPSVVDLDRRKRGDYYKKPTQFWFLNVEPKLNLVMDYIPRNSIGAKDAIRKMTKKDWEKTGATSIKEARSMIHPEYANRFIREFIITQGEDSE